MKKPNIDENIVGGKLCIAWDCLNDAIEELGTHRDEDTRERRRRLRHVLVEIEEAQR